MIRSEIIGSETSMVTASLGDQGAGFLLGPFFTVVFILVVIITRGRR